MDRARLNVMGFLLLAYLPLSFFFMDTTNMSMSASWNNLDLRQVAETRFLQSIIGSSTADATPESDSSNNNQSFSACLLVMDDNHRLDEWIAYHWYVLPLRYLVIAVDPHSNTSPTAVLNKWRRYMNIIEWTDSNFTLDNLMIQPDDDPDLKKRKHRTRQTSFYVECARHLMQANRTWTSYVDIDEFLTLNRDIVGEKDEQLPYRSGSVMKMLLKYSSNETSSTTEQEKRWYRHFQGKVCVSIPRSLYSAVESAEDKINKGVPPNLGFNATQQLETLRFRYRATAPRGKSRDGLGKSLLDVSQVQPNDLKPGTAHRPIGICPRPLQNYDEVPIGIHHYLGSWESYSSREDARKGTLRNVNVWTERSVLQSGGADDEVRPWLEGFVREVGVETAGNLLRMGGIPPTKQDNETASWVKIGT